MKLSGQVRSISHLKANAAELIRDLEERRTPYVITQNGEAKAVLQDVASYEEMQEGIALLKILALSKAEADAGWGKPFRKAFRDVRNRTKEWRRDAK